MKIVRLETFLTHAGLRNYLFLRLTADSGLTGVGEASLEWQERAVECLLHDWVEERILGQGPGRDNANDVAFDDPLGKFGVLNLLADIAVGAIDPRVRSGAGT